MRDFISLMVHVIVTLVRLAGPGGLRSVVAESALVRHQLLILNRGRKRAPNLRAWDHIAAGLLILFMRPARILRLRHRAEVLHLAAFAQPVEETKVPSAVFVPVRASTRPEGSEQRTHRRRSGHEAA